MRTFLTCVSLSIMLLLSLSGRAQNLLPEKEGERVKYDALIEMPKAYVSGICLMLKEGKCIKGSLFNEFGISALDFIYDTERNRVKLKNVVRFMDKWYIRKALKNDLKHFFNELKNGKNTYKNEKYKINYYFNVLKNDPEESIIQNNREG